MKIEHIAFPSPPPVGTVISFSEQTYKLVGTRPHCTLAGKETLLLLWRSACPECDQNFIYETSLKFSGPNRRCELCVRPGVRVSKRQRVARIR